MKEKKGLLTAY